MGLAAKKGEGVRGPMPTETRSPAVGDMASPLAPCECLFCTTRVAHDGGIIRAPCILLGWSLHDRCAITCAVMGPPRVAAAYVRNGDVHETSVSLVELCEEHCIAFDSLRVHGTNGLVPLAQLTEAKWEHRVGPFAGRPPLGSCTNRAYAAQLGGERVRAPKTARVAPVVHFSPAQCPIIMWTRRVLTRYLHECRKQRVPLEGIELLHVGDVRASPDMPPDVTCTFGDGNGKSMVVDMDYPLIYRLFDVRLQTP